MAEPFVPTTPSAGVLPEGSSSFRVVGSAGWGLSSTATILDDTMTNENSPARKVPYQVLTGTELQVDVPHGTTAVAISFDEDNVYPVTVSTAATIPAVVSPPTAAIPGDAWPLQPTGTSVITAVLDPTNALTLYFNSPSQSPSPEVYINLYLTFL